MGLQAVEMELSLSGKTVAVIGAANGIGKAIADEFRSEGSHVVEFDREPAPVGEVERMVGDVTDYASLRSFAERYDEVEHVVYSVGVGSGKFGFPFWKLDPGDWARVLEINLIGAANVAHAFAPRISKRGCGSFQFLVSVAGQMGSQTDPPYSAAKAGLVNFMQCAAKDLAPFGVRANAISPGMVKTALNESVWAAGQDQLPEAERQSYEDWAESKIKQIAPLGQWQTPEEFAALSVFLASGHARNITGQTLNVDGGQVMHS